MKAMRTTLCFAKTQASKLLSLAVSQQSEGEYVENGKLTIIPELLTAFITSCNVVPAVTWAL